MEQVSTTGSMPCLSAELHWAEPLYPKRFPGTQRCLQALLNPQPPLWSVEISFFCNASDLKGQKSPPKLQTEI
eukprot:3552234-Amphidinium_carterae.1